MAKRKKRLEKGIKSLEKQIKIHEEKKRMAKELDQEELVEYYTKEIKSLTKRKSNRQGKI